MSKTKEDLILQEYCTLREEIFQKIQLQNSLIAFAATATISILAFAVEAENPSLCLLPFGIILPASLNIAYYREVVAKIAAYIMVFIEGNIQELHWETRNHQVNLKKANGEIQENTKEYEKSKTEEHREITDVVNQKEKTEECSDTTDNEHQEINLKNHKNKKYKLRINYPERMSLECPFLSIVCLVAYLICPSTTPLNSSVNNRNIYILVVFCIIEVVITIYTNLFKSKKQVWKRKWEELQK